MSLEFFAKLSKRLLPITKADFDDMTDSLTRSEAKALWNLFVYVWEWGLPLPEDDEDIAREAGVSTECWTRRAADHVLPFFSYDDETGRWRNLKIEEARSKHLDGKAKMSDGGRRTQEILAERRRVRKIEDAQHAASLAADATTARPDGDEDDEGQGRVASRYLEPTLAENDTDPSSSSAGSGVTSYGLTDFPYSQANHLKTGFERTKTSQSVNDPIKENKDARARDAGLGAGGLTETPTASSPDGKVPSRYPEPTLTENDASPSSSSASASLTPIAIDDEIIAAVRDAAGPRLANAYWWKKLESLAAVREALREGCDLHDDIGWKIRDFVKHAAGKLRDPASTAILDGARERRDGRLRKAGKATNEARARAWFADEFWPPWPNKQGRLEAERAAIKLFGELRGAMHPVLDGIERYVRTKPPDRDFMNPARFLGEKRYLDEPPPRDTANMSLTELLNQLDDEDQGAFDGHARVSQPADAPDQGADGFAGRLSIEDQRHTRGPIIDR